MTKRYYQEYGPMKRRRGERPDMPSAMRMSEREEEQEYPEQRYLEQRPPIQRPRRRHPILLGFLITLVVLLAGAGGGLYYLSTLYEGRIYPNIAIMGIDVGQKTPEEARAALEARVAGFRNNPVTISYSGKSWQPSLDELGAQIEIERAIDEAYGAGRGLNLIAGVQQVVTTWRKGLDIPVHLSIDGQQLRRYLEGIAAGLDRPSRDAGLVIKQQSAEVTPAQEGRLTLIDETAADLVASFEGFQPAQVAVRTRVLDPQLHDADVAEAKRTTDAILQSPLTLRAGEKSWELSLDDLRAMLRIEQVLVNGRRQLRAELDELTLRQRIASYADEIGRGTVNPRLRFDPASGTLSVIKPGQIGLRLDEQASTNVVKEQATMSVTRTIELVVNEVKPDASEDNLDALGIKEVVGVGRSSFIGSAPYRITNIKAGSRLLDGILIAPDEEFSFNDTIGTIGPANGFVEGYAIVNNRTQKEFGGGICQDSTTLFRAAFYAGLPITERHEHSFRISWYEAEEPYGMDAAIFTGALDFRFVNDTGHWLLLQTYVDEVSQRVTYTLYGTKPNRQVLRSDPYVTNQQGPPTDPVYYADALTPPGQIIQSDVARGGMDITIYRTIVQNGEVVSKEPFTTRFRPWPNIFTYNPSTPPAGCKPGQPCKPVLPTPEPTPEVTPVPEQPPVEPTPAPPPPVEPTPVPVEPSPVPEQIGGDQPVVVPGN